MRHKEQFYFSIIYQYFNNITPYVYNKSYSKGPLLKKKKKYYKTTSIKVI